MTALIETLRKNRTRAITLAILVLLFLMAIQGMDTEDWIITTLRGLSVAAVTFLVASGFSLIFGLMDVLNLAQGTLFMIGAYVGWTVYVRPDTFVDAATPLALVVAGLLLMPLWGRLLGQLRLPANVARFWPWFGLALALLVLALTVPRFPIASWDPGNYNQSPITYAGLMDRDQLVVPEPGEFSGLSPAVGLLGALLGGALLSASLVGFARRRQAAGPSTAPWPWTAIVASLVLLVLGLGAFAFNDSLTETLLGFNTTWLFVLAVVVATLVGAGLGGLIEAAFIRPLYARPLYQLMLTLGLSAIGVEVVRVVWGRPEFTMPKPALFSGTGEGCPATGLGGWLSHECSTISFMGSRIRTYNEVFIILVGLVVLVVVWLLMQRTRLGMIIRAGVQDSEMVEALGINVRQVFTLVFALGVGLAALGGALSGPYIGLSNGMGESLLLKALIALAIGGLTSYPGAAVGSILVGLMEQFIIKYGRIGIGLPFLSEPFKPTPPLVPASTVLLMVIILLVLPQGLFGREE